MKNSVSKTENTIQNNGLLLPVTVIKGVGPSKAAALASIGIDTLQDLLNFFPRRYLDRNLTDNVLLKTGETVTLIVEVIDAYLAHGKKSRLVVGTKTRNNERISIVFFRGVNFFQKIFQPGTTLVATGKLEYFRGFQLIHPDYEILTSAIKTTYPISSTGSKKKKQEQEPEEELSELPEMIHAGRIIPLYPSGEVLKSEGLDSRGFRKILYSALEKLKGKIPEILPNEILKRRGLILREESYREIHFPTDENSLDTAKYRLKYEELFYFNLLIEHKKKEREKIKRVLWPLPESETANKVRKNLPFQLTEDQNSALQKIKELTNKEQPIAVLLQGDVGSGKTLVALLTALRYIDNQIQVCMVAPTEILARQHYQTILSFLGNMPFLGIELLVGKEPKKNRYEKLYRIKKGDTLFVIGTHSVFQEDVYFSELGLVIIDEQHKFGVDQRETLRSKGKNPDILAMTATPIPRTLCLTLYGDLDLLTIKSKPKGRMPIQTKWFQEDRREGIYKSIRKYVSSGRQCYIVYPLVEESEKVDLKSCIEAYEYLKHEIFPDFEVGLVHGKMEVEEKDRVMREFSKNRIQILVSTTVIEVGIDVPNSTVMVIEHADRFGISQLHQLRGRVGRGDQESFCILMTDSKVTEDAKVRLEAMVNFSDGFALSEIDLQLRGPGELMGVRQSGLPDFKIADLRKDSNLIELTREDATLFGNPGDLEKEEIRGRFSEGRLLFSN
ncbi:ATP-dependent DNA helicase RecG [Leptospira interrogans]|uniref:ATP-dependent DNA helicase RecG n=1 Tax=Leptospira interrogans TaxID=173 RepID=UPI0002BB7CEA|nr:ATP-dependent DNA helicase RecG [Leptospira interrogans]MCR8647410.1 ATP-dependent DNA helicase RecG [Leptospira interrogans serovar Bataviae]OAM72728.1 ATP-dependent DNA helicase RecG [Leptospira interrogans serovar Bataviae]QOI39861.1 ATP-dependent DNA helicase RecG [Leptospira interrogans serovar Bataviae]QYY60113.1 ATP-dependent DNA helicase RecG [Leptospira interrogans serovar Bataviae]